MELATDTLVEFIRRSRKGDATAMEAIYTKFKTPIFNLALRHTNCTSAAEDILHDTFVRVLSHLGTLEKEEAFVGWLYRIAINTIFSYLRGKKFSREKTQSLDDLDGTRSEPSVAPSAQLIGGPLEKAIRELPAKMRTVLLLHDMQDFKHEEIAHVLGCSVGTSKSQLFKARQRLRTFLTSPDESKGKNDAV